MHRFKKKHASLFIEHADAPTNNTTSRNVIKTYIVLAFLKGHMPLDRVDITNYFLCILSVNQWYF